MQGSDNWRTTRVTHWLARDGTRSRRLVKRLRDEMKAFGRKEIDLDSA